MAIAAFQRTLLPTDAPWQRYLRGDATAMSPKQLWGAELFFGEAGCADCHGGPSLSLADGVSNFAAFGMGDLEGDEVVLPAGDDPRRVQKLMPARVGRSVVTQNPDDVGKYKTPQLYNLRDMAYFGHGATFGSVREVVEYKNEGRPQQSEVVLPDGSGAVPIGGLSEFRPLELTEAEVDALVEFLESGLYDDDLSRYEPTLPVCFPNADEQSRRESAQPGC